MRPFPNRILLFFLFFLLSAPSVGISAQPARPNLVAIVTDDQGLWTVDALGYPNCRTPHLDRLVREGAHFTNAFTVTPVCSPSRAEYMTGRWSTELGITDWISPDEAGRGLGVPVETPIWPQLLQKAGYRTALFGKWHLGDRPQFHPNRRGIDHFFGFLGGGTTPMNPRIERNGVPEQLEGYLEDNLAADAVRWIGENRERPFALLFHTRAPHLPYGPVPDEDRQAVQDLDLELPRWPGYDEKQVRTWTRDYHASIHSVDRAVGRLLNRLDELGLAQRTIVTFTSDHGYNIGHHLIHTKGNGYWIAGGQQGPKRPNMWDTSLRVPLLVRWPGVVKPGRRIEQTALNLDTFPTMLGMLGVPLPGVPRQRGRDLSPLLRGEAATDRTEFFGQYDLHNSGLAYMRMIRTPEWKLVRHFHARHMDELYHLSADPEERRNLYTAEPQQKIRQDLEQKLYAWMRSIDDPLVEAIAKEAGR